LNSKLSLNTKLIESGFNNVNLTGISPEQWIFLYFNFFTRKKRNLFIFSKEDEAEAYFQKIKTYNKNSYFYPELGSDIYEGKLASQYNLLRRFHCIDKILNYSGEISIVTTLKSSLLTIPAKDFFSEQNFCLRTSDIISREDLSKKLLHLGFRRTPTTEEPGTFSPKGEIFDIYPFEGNPKRIIFFDDMIEEIKDVDSNTLITIANTNLESIIFSKTQHTLLDDKYINQFVNSFPRPQLNEHEKYNFRRQIIKKLRDNYFFEDYPCYIGYFLDKKSTLIDYLGEFQIHFFNTHSSFEELQIFQNETTTSQELYIKHSDDIKPDIKQVYDFEKIENLTYLSINEVDLTSNLEENIVSQIPLKIKDLQSKYSFANHTNDRFKILCDLIRKNLSYKKTVVVAYDQENKKDEIIHKLKTLYSHLDIGSILFKQLYLSKGFEYESEDLIVISSSDFFPEKIRKVKKKPNYEKDMFAEQLGTLSVGDYIIHKDFGVGKYLGLETLELAENISDYIIIEYKDSDKIYLPVYKLNLIQKYASNDVKTPLSNLKTQKF
jgi:transcription-repair coupling factor (superfamily II helicase)